MNGADLTFPLCASRTVRISVALLCLAVAAIHVVDQGGLAIRDPRYVGVGYLLLEVGAVVAAALLVYSGAAAGWLLAVAVGAGPLSGYLLSRGPGLPGYTDDIGNWIEPLGLLSLAVEGLLLAAALAALSYARRGPEPEGSVAGPEDQDSAAAWRDSVPLR
jgi:hypothetical protein